MLSVALSLILAEAKTAGRYPAPLFRGARTFLVESKLPPRPPGPLAAGDMGYWGLGSKSASSLARHSPSMIPSIMSGRKRRWKAITAFWVSVTS